MVKEKRSTQNKNTIFRMISENELSSGEELLEILMRTPSNNIKKSHVSLKPVPSFSIDRIILDGFGPHGGPNTLEFRDGLTLLTGENGTGKTHILLAVHWCLFGERGSLDPWLNDADPLGKDLVNWDRITADDHRMTVEVLFKWEGAKYKAVRSLMEGNEEFTFEGPSGSYPSVNISPIGLTPDMLPYLIFQGEAVMFLASEDTFLREGNLKSVIRSLSGAADISRSKDIMDEARSLLIERSRNLRETVGPKEKELKKLENELDLINENCIVKKDRISDLTNKRKNALGEYRKALSELSRMGAVTKEEEQRAMAKARAPVIMEKLQKMLSSADVEILRSMADRALSQCLKEKDERITKRMMYGALESQASIIRNIAETGKCLCGTSIGRTGMGRENIKALLIRLEARRDELEELGKESIWTSDQVLEGVRRCLALPRFDRGQYLDTIKDLEDMDRTLQSRGMEVDNDMINDLISNVREYERITVLVDREKDEMARLNEEKKAKETSIKNIQNEIVELWGIKEGSKGMADRLKLIICAIDDLNSTIKDMMNKMREGIEKRSNETMMKLDPKSKFGKIRIHPLTYRLGREIEKKEGMSTLPMAYLSAGERELMALSVLSSIPGISEGMLMLDSPFPYIDSSRRSRIIERLPLISKKVFISLPYGTLTDEEIEQARKIWSKRGSSLRQYSLEMRKGGSIMIERGGEQ